MTRVGFRPARLARAIGCCCAVAIAAAAIGWVAIGLGPRPLLVNKSGLSQAVYDREGHLLRLTLSSDEKYRLWVPLAEIPPAMIEATLLQEDAWFRWHPGVNPVSLIRAAFTTYLGRGRRVGGSTVAMQLARQRFGINSRSWRGKLEQILTAIWIARYYSRNEILEAYLNVAPYGGNVEGVGAASILYFGTQVRHLSVAQALTLAVIPQSPRLRTRLQPPEGSLWHARVRGWRRPGCARIRRPMILRSILPSRPRAAARRHLVLHIWSIAFSRTTNPLPTS
jgi:penicillin-binding protein 1C